MSGETKNISRNSEKKTSIPIMLKQTFYYHIWFIINLLSYYISRNVVMVLNTRSDSLNTSKNVDVKRFYSKFYVIIYVPNK